jgi:hypothetical protein
MHTTAIPVAPPRSQSEFSSDTSRTGLKSDGGIAVPVEHCTALFNNALCNLNCAKKSSE